MSRFFAEDFRNLLDTINRIAEDDSEHLPDPNDLLINDRPDNIEKDSVSSINDLINYLDQFPELSEYRDQNAKFDDAFYADVPLDTLLNVTELTQDDLERINNESEPDTGAVNIDNNNVSIFGNDSNV